MAVRPLNALRHAVRYWLLRRLPTCKAMVPVMSQSLERRLTLKEQIVLKVHLFICVWCAWYLDQLRLLRAAALARGSQSPDEAPPAPPMPADARERIRRALAEKRSE